VVARQDLLELDPDLAKREFLPLYRRRLRSKKEDLEDEQNLAGAIWRVAQFQDLESLPQLRTLAESHRRSWIRMPAAVAILMPEGRGQEILERLRAHDHDWTGWLAVAATLMRTPAATAALEECAAHAPDERCRRECEVRLKRMRPVRLFGN